MRRKTPLFVIIIAAVFIGVMVLLNYSVIRPGVRIFSVKKYDSPRAAFEAFVPKEALGSEVELGKLEVDGSNVISVYSTGNSGIALAQVWEQKGKFFYAGEFRLLSGEQLSSDDVERVDSFVYGEDGKCTGKLSYFVSLDDSAAQGWSVRPFYGGGPEGTVYLHWIITYNN